MWCESVSNGDPPASVKVGDLRGHIIKHCVKPKGANTMRFKMLSLILKKFVMKFIGPNTHKYI